MMYFIVVLLFLFVCPLTSVVMEAHQHHQTIASLILIGRWFTFWAVGVRLFAAGARQVIQPRFTAEEIFEIHDLSALPLIREIGFGNLSIGTIGICSVFHTEWTLPAAIVGGLYYGFAGAGHLPQKNKNAKETTAMVSDWFAAAVLGWFALRSLIQI